MKNIDTVIMGRKTLDWIIVNAPEFSYVDKETYIISHTVTGSQPGDFPKNLEDNTTQEEEEEVFSKIPSTYLFYSGDLKTLADRLISENKRIFLVGGAEIILQLLNHKLVNEFKIAIIPVLLGNGIPLFKPGYPGHSIVLKDVRQNYDTGVIMYYTTKPRSEHRQYIR
jgi:dihydrofolate reductase